MFFISDRMLSMQISKFILSKLLSVLFLGIITFGVFADTPDEKLVSSVNRSETGNIAQALKDGANPNLADANGNTILMMACMFGQKETVRLLLEKGADVNVQARNGNTTLMIASQNNRLEIIKLLLAKNPDISAKNKDGKTCLDIALAKNFSEAAKLILKSGQPVKLTPSMLYLAARSKDTGLLQLLKDKSDDNNLSKDIDKSIDEIEKRTPRLASSKEIIFLISILLLTAVFSALFIWKKQGHSPAKKKIPVWIASTAGSFIILIGIIYAAICMIWNIQLSLALSALEKSGRPLKIAQIIPAPVPDSENAAIELKEAFILISEQGRPYTPGNYRGMIDRKLQRTVIQFGRNIGSGSTKQIINKISSAETKRILSSDRVDNAFSLMEKAARKTACNFNLNYDRQGHIPSPHSYYLSNAVTLWINKACVEASEGNYETAYNILFNALKISELQDKEPTLQSYFSGVANIANTARVISMLAGEYGISDKYAMKFMDEIQNMNFDRWLQNACDGEKINTISIFDAVINNKKIDERLKRSISSHKSPSWISSCFPGDKKDFACYLNTWAEIDKLYSLPPWERIEKIKNITVNIPESCPMSKFWLGRFLTEAFAGNAYFMNQTAICELTLALQIYKNKKSTYPDTLDKLKPDILHEIPLDSLNGKPLIYKTEGNSFTLTAEGSENLQKNVNRNRRR